MEVSALLQAWQAQGLDRIAPVRFHHVAALHRRAVRQEGRAKQLLERRLAELIQAHATPMADMAGGDDATGTGAVSGPATGKGDMTPGLLGALASLRPVLRNQDDAENAPEREPEVLTDLRQIWSAMLVRSQIQQSLATPSPSDAGPLNSATLVHRALALMREQSPGYLQHFLAYADTLSWLEHMGGSDRAAPPGRRGKP